MPQKNGVSRLSDSGVLVPGTGVEPALSIIPTWPSTMRVCQFRHPGWVWGWRFYKSGVSFVVIFLHRWRRGGGAKEAITLGPDPFYFESISQFASQKKARITTAHFKREPKPFRAIEGRKLN